MVMLLLLAIKSSSPMVTTYKESNSVTHSGNLWFSAGFLALLISCVAWWVAFFYNAPMDWISRHWLQIVTAGIVYSYLIAIWMYVRALRAPEENLAPESTGMSISRVLDMLHWETELERNPVKIIIKRILIPRMNQFDDVKKSAMEVLVMIPGQRRKTSTKICIP